MARPSGKSFRHCHSPSNSTGTSNQRNRYIWISFFNSTNSSRIFYNVELETRGSAWIHIGKSFNLDSHWEELQKGFQKILQKGISFKGPMEITKGWKPNSQFKLLEQREAKIRENRAIIEAIKGQWNGKGYKLISSGSHKVVNQPKSPVTSQHSEYNKSVAKSPYFPKSTIFPREEKDQEARRRLLTTRRRKTHI
ncbi:hypothetical protein O181_003184 [Austropuccinia psidii MF-1]|uniref:Uncharacterized protein n=1 Tax=Austropuccinia psidii MF-1 TaxID=1389203 RepID=A0A9Q3BDN4_9BASI|nr:hypothetical protein [Austropuccinia psidii MF-1]